MGGSGWPSSGEGRQATRALVGGLAGANGWERVSMCQMASVSLRATSTRGDPGAPLLAESLLGAQVVAAVAGVAGSVGRGLDQRPAQIGWAVFGQRAALVAAAGLVDPGAQPRLAAQLLGRGEAGDVAHLGGDGGAQHPGDPGCGHQQRHIGVVGAQPPQLLFAALDLVVQVVDEGQGRGDVADPRLGQYQASKQLPAAGAKAGR
jgi:hypothetical protein